MAPPGHLLWVNTVACEGWVWPQPHWHTGRALGHHHSEVSSAYISPLLSLSIDTVDLASSQKVSMSTPFPNQSPGKQKQQIPQDPGCRWCSKFSANIGLHSEHLCAHTEPETQQGCSRTGAPGSGHMHLPL